MTVIVCLRLPYFAADVLRRKHRLSQEAGIGIVRRGKVIATCGAAAQADVQIGLTVRQARAVLRDLVVVEADDASQQEALDRLLAVLADFTPWLEYDSEPPQARRKSLRLLSDEQQAAVLYTDFETLQPADVQRIAMQMSAAVQNLIGIVPRIGVAGGKFPAYAAACKAEPGEFCFVPAGHEGEFLTAFPIRVLPLDEESYRRLIMLGLQTLGQLAALPADAMLAQFGPRGFWWHRLTQGKDERPVVPHPFGLSERVVRECEDALINQVRLEALLRAMAVELSARVRAKGCMGRTLVLTLRFDNQTRRTRRLTLRQPVSDAPHLSQHLLQLEARMLPLPHGILRIEVVLQDLAPLAGQQLDLFVYQTHQRRRLTETLDTLSARYGPKPFLWITPADPTARRIEQRYRLRPINES